MDLADLRARAQRWIADDPDPATRAELHALLAKPDPASTDLADRFAGALQFGTAGLRGVLGAGPNRMNRAVIARFAWGLARELLESVPGAADRGVVVGGDARRMSLELVEDVASILAGVGLRVVLFREPVPTPLVGFTVKRLGAAAGVVVTASHNPPEYNGCKVYWENAAQIVPPVDARIAAAIARAPSARAVVRPPLQVLREKARVVDAPVDAERAYLDAVRALAVHPEAGDRGIRIVYTPLHGVGDALVRQALAEARFAHVESVPEQRSPDGEFPTVAFPNPEEPGAMDRALALASATSAELVLANDPDADRLAIAVPADGRAPGGRALDDRASGRAPEWGAFGGPPFHQLTGNELGVLLGHYLLTEKPASRPRAVLASIVSSPLLGRIAVDLGVHYEETLTGFKWLAGRSLALEREGYDVVFAYEEALGYCVGNAVRDKDGISAALLAAEVTAVLRARGQTVGDALDSIARRWGVFTSAQVSLTRKGADGAGAIASMMDALRAAPPEALDGDAVVAVADYAAGVRSAWPERRPRPAAGMPADASPHVGADAPSHQPSRSSARALGLPKSNVLVLEMASGSRVIARPSGTEPKAKFYFDVRALVGPGEPVAAARARALAAQKRLAAAFAYHAGSAAAAAAAPGSGAAAPPDSGASNLPP
jgi:phosphomannomutase